jgi:hypothetical protein
MPGIQLEIHVCGDGDTPREYVTLTAYDELKRDLDAANQDIRDMRKNKRMLKSELNEIATIRQERQYMKEREDKLALFLREHYKREISMGQHGGMDLVDVVIKYLGRERILTKNGEAVPA